MEDAPFFDDLVNGWPAARAVWVHAEDGARLRLGLWQPDDAARGTVLVFPGRTEYIEKYAHVAARLLDRGLAVLAVDWRGQGLSERLLGEPLTGHVGRFSDYQRDVAAMLAVARAEALPAPIFLLAHSMGGCIGLRALMDGLDVAGAAFTGPMWGIRISALMRPAAWAISWSGARLGLGHVVAPGTGPQSYIATAPFEGNTLTTDAGMWATMQSHLHARPELQLGGPSLHWLHEALAECRALARRPAPDLPAIAWLGSRERIVDQARVHDRMRGWPSGRLELLESAEHEVLMERAEIRDRILRATASFFLEQAGEPA